MKNITNIKCSFCDGKGYHKTGINKIDCLTCKNTGIMTFTSFYNINLWKRKKFLRRK